MRWNCYKMMWRVENGWVSRFPVLTECYPLTVQFQRSHQNKEKVWLRKVQNRNKYRRDELVGSFRLLGGRWHLWHNLSKVQGQNCCSGRMTMLDIRIKIRRHFRVSCLYVKSRRRASWARPRYMTQRPPRMVHWVAVAWKGRENHGGWVMHHV